MEEQLVRIGLDRAKAAESAGNPKLSKQLADVLSIAQVGENGCEKSVGMLLYHIATKFADHPHRDLLVRYVAAKKIATQVQLDAAVAYLKRTNSTAVNTEEFERECGVGVVVTAEQIERAVAEELRKNKDTLLGQRYQAPLGAYLANVRQSLKWADGKSMKESFDKQILELLGPKTESDTSAPKKKKEPSKPTPAAAAATGAAVDGGSSSGPSASEESDVARAFSTEVSGFHKPGENPQIKPELMVEHLKATGGKVMTRFPPEPNGFLHIGHAKAMNFNFRYAAFHGGNTYLRFDDTNPEAEEDQYFKSIQECVEWMGWRPFKVTATSDYFDKLHELAVRMIKNGKAYICHMTAEEMHLSRGGDNQGPRTESPWRNRPIEENLRLFEDMRKGKFREHEATLRMKMDMQSGNPYMWDPVAYRVMYSPHVRTGDKWCIYPTYDFSHCLTDSIENITHSFCTVEFKLAREAYYWVCDAVEVYKPVQWEYGRLNITNTVLSKRKLMKLVNEKIVDGWDDPRLYTIEGLRRRGFTPRAINNFVEKIGITTALTTVNVKMLEACVRDDLNLVAKRAKVVLDPLKVTLVNIPEDRIIDVQAKWNPVDANSETHVIPLARVIYIDRSDFREEDSAEYYRLSPNQPVGLANASSIRLVEMVRDAAGQVAELRCEYLEQSSAKPKSFIHWVADCPSRSSPVRVEVRLYANLFLSDNPETHPDGFLADVNPNSLTVKHDALGDVSVLGAKPFDKFQFERVGYFCVDTDSTPSHAIFNRTVSLREDSKKTY